MLDTANPKQRRGTERNSISITVNKYNRDKGTYGNGDGLDAAHSGSRIRGFLKRALNRANNRPKKRNSK